MIINCTTTPINYNTIKLRKGSPNYLYDSEFQLYAKCTLRGSF